MNEKELLKNIQSKKTIIICSFIIVFLFIAIYLLLVRNVTNMYTIDISKYKQSDVKNYGFYIDELNYGNYDSKPKKDYVSISGWFSKNNEEIKTISMNIILQNKSTNVSYLIPTDVYQRAEVNNYFNDGYDHTYSGFSLRIPRFEDLDYDDYEIYMLITLNGNTSLVNLNTTIKTW